MNILRPSRTRRPLFLLMAAMLLLTLGQVSATSAQTVQYQVAAGYFDAVQGGATYSLMSPRSVLHTPDGSFAGVEGPTRFGAKLDESFSNVTFATQGSRTVGEYVIVDFTLTGIHTGTYHEMEPACSAVSAPGVAILHLGDEGITQQWISYDPGTLVAQIDAFGQIDANSRPTCESQGRVQLVPEIVAPDICLDLDSCSYMP